MYASPVEVAASIISLQSSPFGGHAPLYDRPVRLLMRDMADEFQVGPGDIFTREEALNWFQKRYPLVKEGTIVAHLTRLSTNNPTRLHYNARTDDDLFFQVESGGFGDTIRDPILSRFTIARVCQMVQKEGARRLLIQTRQARSSRMSTTCETISLATST